MSELTAVAPAFVELAHRIVWATVATVDRQGRPRSRILHPYWTWDGSSLAGWVLTSPTALKRAHLERTPFASVNYWAPTHDVATAECRASLDTNNVRCVWLWEQFRLAPEPLGYDPAIIPPWSDGPTSDAVAVLRLEPWRLRVMPGTMMAGGPGELLTWEG